MPDLTPSHLESLADLLLAEALHLPLSDVAEPAWVADRVEAALDAVLADEALPARWAAAWQAARAEAGTVSAPLRDAVPPPLLPPLRRLAGLPWSPSERLAMAAVDHPAVRLVLREVLSSALNRLVDRVRRIDQGVLGGLGGRAAKRSRGLFAGVASMASAAAEGVAGAVADEFGQALDSKLREVLGTATEDGVRSIASYLSDPEHAAAFGSLRVQLMDVVLDLPVQDAAAELDSLDVEALLRDTLAEIGTARQDPAVREHLLSHATTLLDRWGDATLHDLLTAAGLATVATDSLRPLLVRRLHAFVATEGFAAWWADATQAGTA